MPVPKRANPSAHNTPIQSYHIKVIETDMFNRGEPLVCNMANNQTPQTRTIFNQSDLTAKARSLMGRLSVADVHSIEASQIISEMLDLEDEAEQFHAMTRKTESVMWQVRDMIETTMAMIEDGFKI